jgi:hypothetical protein
MVRIPQYYDHSRLTVSFPASIVDRCKDDRKKFSKFLISGFLLKIVIVADSLSCSDILPFTAIFHPSEDKIQLKFWLFVHHKILGEKFVPVSEEMRRKLFWKLRIAT